MKEIKFREIAGYDSFIEECSFFLLTEEYPGWTGQEKYGIVTASNEEDLKHRYPELMAALCPYLLLNSDFGEVRREYIRGEKKHLWRSLFTESAFDFDEDTECCHKCLQHEYLEADTERSLLIRDLLERIPEVQRNRIIRYFFNGLTYKEIAALEGTTKTAILYSIRRALKNLKNICAET